MIEQGNKFVSADFLRVLKALKENILLEINVADVFQVVSVSEQNEYLCKSITDGATISAISLDINDIIQVGDFVLVVFTNTDFRVNLRRIKSGLTPLEYESIEKHSKAFGVIVKIIPQ